MESLLCSSLRPSTLKQYNHHLKSCFMYVIYNLGVRWITPLNINIIAAFYGHLFEMGLSYSSIVNYNSAISYYHKIRGLVDPTNTFYIRKLLQGIHRRKPRKPGLKPINMALLKKIVSNLHIISLSKYDIYLYRAIMITMYFGCLRVSEVMESAGLLDHTLTVNLIECLVCDGQTIAYKLMLKTFKHNYTQPFTMKLVKAKDIVICPVKALTDYLQIRPNVGGSLFIDENRKGIKRAHFAQVLKLVLEKLGIDSGKYNTHSFRIGRTTDMAMGGFSHEKIKILGRWESDAYRKYIRPTLIEMIV